MAVRRSVGATRPFRRSWMVDFSDSNTFLDADAGWDSGFSTQYRMQKRNAVFGRRVEIGVECGTREGKRARSEAKVSPLNSHLAAPPGIPHSSSAFCIGDALGRN